MSRSGSKRAARCTSLPGSGPRHCTCTCEASPLHVARCTPSVIFPAHDKIIIIRQTVRSSQHSQIHKQDFFLKKKWQAIQPKLPTFRNPLERCSAKRNRTRNWSRKNNNQQTKTEIEDEMNSGGVEEEKRQKFIHRDRIRRAGVSTKSGEASTLRLSSVSLMATAPQQSARQKDRERRSLNNERCDGT